MKIRAVSSFFLFVLLTLFSAGQSFGREFLDRDSSVFFVGNGGDSIFCYKNDNSFSDIYTLDFYYSAQHNNATDLIATNDRLNNQFDSVDLEVVSGITIDELIENDFIDFLIKTNGLSKSPNYIEAKILNLFKRNNSHLFRDLNSYYLSKLNLNRNSKRVWQSTLEIDDLVDIEDEELELRFDCFKKQIVIRSEVEGQIFYTTHPLGLAKLTSFPLQESFLFIHEWLWNHFKSAKKIREVNWFLHSKAAHIMPKEQFNLKLKQLGFIF